MPTVLRIDGWRIVIYLNDHPPAHVHAVRPGAVVVINLLGPELREVIGCNERDARLVLREVSARREALLEEWRRLHG